jgi:arylformamidase
MRLFRDFTSQEEIDLEYDLALTVPDLEHWIEWFTQESVTARRKLDCVLDVRFGPTVDETVDIFPAKEQGVPLLVFIHGGYWVLSSSKDYSFVGNGLVSQGITVVVTNYSLCPKVSIAEITRQSRAVIAWLHKEAPNFNADPSRIFVAGHSAGGHQVGMLSATDWPGEYGLPNDVIKGGIPISGIFDLSPLRYSFLQPRLLLTHEVILRQSPVLNIPHAGPPLLITFGKEETAEFHRQSTEYLQAWRANGLQGESLVQKGKHHFSALEGLNEPHSPLCKALIDFLARCESLLDSCYQRTD